MRLFTRELFPLAGGHAAFGLLLLTVVLYAAIGTAGPAVDGSLFGASPMAEAFVQSGLVVAPLLCVYLALRTLRRDRDAFLAYLALSGGAILGMVLGVGFFLAV